MGADKGTKSKATKTKKKLLTKKDKIRKRVSRVHKAIAKKKMMRDKHVGEIRAKRRKLRQNQ